MSMHAVLVVLSLLQLTALFMLSSFPSAVALLTPSSASSLSSSYSSSSSLTSFPYFPFSCFPPSYPAALKGNASSAVLAPSFVFCENRRNPHASSSAFSRFLFFTGEAEEGWRKQKNSTAFAFQRSPLSAQHAPRRATEAAGYRSSRRRLPCAPLAASPTPLPALSRLHADAKQQRQQQQQQEGRFREEGNGAALSSQEPRDSTDGPEASLLHQQQQLAALLDPPAAEREREEEDAAPVMTDEEFAKEVGVSIRSRPSLVLTALSNWRRKNPSSPLASQLHKKWMIVFEKIVLNHLHLYEEEMKTENSFAVRAQRLLLGGTPLSAGPNSAMPQAPSELDLSYSEMAGVPKEFKKLTAAVREEEASKRTARTVFNKLCARAKYFLPLIAVGSAVQKASLTCLLAAGGIAGRAMSGSAVSREEQPAARGTPPPWGASARGAPPLKAFLRTAAALGGHALFGFASAYCGWSWGGLRHWISLRGLATACIVAQWWAASSFYEFSKQKKKSEFQMKLEMAEERTAADTAADTPESEGESRKEWLFNDAELPTAFRDEDA
ncbi:hypothetical protein Efla_004907 [Eimeria flavescens]